MDTANNMGNHGYPGVLQRGHRCLDTVHSEREMIDGFKGFVIADNVNQHLVYAGLFQPESLKFVHQPPENRDEQVRFVFNLRDRRQKGS
jgi:hypothetical protein